MADFDIENTDRSWNFRAETKKTHYILLVQSVFE